MNSTASVKREDSDEVFALKERVRDLEALVGLHWAPPRVLGLTRTQAQLFGLLIRHRTLCTYEMILTALYGERTDPPGVEVIRAHITHIRRLLEPHGLTVRRLWGSGYYLTPEDIARIDALYAPGERP